MIRRPAARLLRRPARASVFAVRAASVLAPGSNPGVLVGGAPPSAAELEARNERIRLYRQSRATEKQLITQLFGYLKRSSEVRQYLKYYASVDSDKFAIISVSGDVLHEPEEATRVASSLAFLHRVGLCPIVVHGAGLFTGRRSSELRSALEPLMELEEMDAEPSPELLQKTMLSARNYMEQANHSLVEALHGLGVSTAPLPMGVFEVEPDPNYHGPLKGLVGRIVGTNLDAIQSSIEEGSLPVVASMGWSVNKPAPPVLAPASDPDDVFGAEAANASGSGRRRTHVDDDDDDDDDGVGGRGGRGDSAAFGQYADMDRILTFPTAMATEALTRLVKPLKVIYLRSAGALHRRDGSRVKHVTLATDFDRLVSNPEDLLDGASSSPSSSSSSSSPSSSVSPRSLSSLLQPSDASLLREVHGLFERGGMDVGSTVAVTAPAHLAAELFSHKGAGTLITRGERIGTFYSLDGLDHARLTRLLEMAFGATLPDTYFKKIQPKLRSVYATESLRGVAIVTNEGGLPYLDKFAVDPNAQGEKLGETLWKALVEGEPSFYWRSRTTNKINPWYFEQSDGCYKAFVEPTPSAPTAATATATAAYASASTTPPNIGGEDAVEEPARVSPRAGGKAAPTTGPWTVFWRGLTDAEIMPAIEHALLITPTFVRAPTEGTVSGSDKGGSDSDTTQADTDNERDRTPGGPRPHPAGATNPVAPPSRPRFR